MKTTKKVLVVLGLILGLATLMSSTCNNNSEDSPDPECDGYIQATSTGIINNTFCFDSSPEYIYNEADQRVNFNASVTIDEVSYICDVSVYPYTGAKSYDCAPDKPGYVELVIHGNESEFYKSQSGTLTITQADATHLKATFDVIIKGYYNQETASLKGTVFRVN